MSATKPTISAEKMSRPENTPWLECGLRLGEVDQSDRQKGRSVLPLAIEGVARLARLGMFKSKTRESLK